MLFHSLSYAALLATVFFVGGCLPQRSRWLLLLLASVIFYGSWRWEYLALLFFTAATCHYAAISINDSRNQTIRRRWLIGSISANLSVLFLFKYYGLFSVTLNRATGMAIWNDLGLLLPVGISFYTFQAIGYVVDVYRGQTEPERSLPRTLLFVSFFPQLVAGPIERAGRLLPALREPIRYRWASIRIGLWLILWGLFKKVVIADRLSLLVDAAYDSPESQSGVMLLVATYAFAFQIYCDFSGYSDMAIGSAKLLGIELMQNFRLPYAATSLRDFWSRWHISLSTWFRDYLYIPLGGNRGTRAGWLCNIIIVFGLSGLWHGAEWTFVIWGLLHGGIMGIETLIDGRRPGRGNKAKPRSSLESVIATFSRQLLTFHIVLLAWIFFRSASLSDAMQVFAGIMTRTEIATGAFILPPAFNRFEALAAAFCLVLMLVIEHASGGDVRRVLATRPRLWRRLVIIGTILLIMNFGVFSHPTQFVYFQF